MTAPAIGPSSVSDRLEKLERANHNLAGRIAQLEKQRASTIAALAANVILLVCAVLIVDYLGFLPPFVQRLPMAASIVAADEFVLRDADGKPWGKIHVSQHQAVLTRFGADGQAAKEEPLMPAK
jgi:hypothetical protein